MLLVNNDFYINKMLYIVRTMVVSLLKEAVTAVTLLGRGRGHGRDGGSGSGGIHAVVVV